MKTEVRKITPKIAKEMLKKNFNNRKLNNPHVNYLSRQMLDNQWQFDGQPIRFDKYGRLLDGQHRLSAVVKSGETIKFLIISGLEESTFKVMDTGKNRSSGDVLSTLGIKYCNDVSSVARSVIKFKEGSYSKSNSRGSTKTTNTDIINWYKENEKIEDIVRKADVLRSNFSGVLSRTKIATLLYLFNEINVGHSEIFMSKLCNGLDLDVNSPIYILRKKLIEDKMAKSSLPYREVLALICKAWNLYRLNKSCKVLRWNKETEKFPNLI